MFYSGRLKGKLKDLLDNEVSKPAEEQLSLLEELALMREFVSQTLRGYEAAQTITDDAKRKIAIEAATIAAMGGLESVKDICLTAARVDQLVSGHVSQHSLRVIIGQMVRVMYDVCEPDHRDLAEEFERRIQRDVKLPSREAVGTTLTPDQDVLEMDNVTTGEES